jgi:oligopeptide transport system substrate-binding protein
MRIRLWLQITCIFIVLSLLITACSCINTNSGDTSSNGTLTFFDVSPLTLDPAIARSDASLTYIVEIFGGLVSFDPELNLTPDIAERWEVSSDGKTYTFYLRNGVKFHNGRDVTATDFKYSIERACTPE